MGIWKTCCVFFTCEWMLQLDFKSQFFELENSYYYFTNKVAQSLLTKGPKKQYREKKSGIGGHPRRSRTSNFNISKDCPLNLLLFVHKITISWRTVIFSTRGSSCFIFCHFFSILIFFSLIFCSLIFSTSYHSSWKTLLESYMSTMEGILPLPLTH